MEIRTTQDYEANLRTCQRCAALMKGKPVEPARSTACVEPRPIIIPLRKKPLMLIGQAPGLTEYTTGKPFSGDAGQAVRKVFTGCGCEALHFDELVHSAAVVKCFPGSRLVTKGPRSRREDLKPSPEMIVNCSPFIRAQIEIVDPAYIVLLGAVPLSAYLYWKTGEASRPALREWVGRRDDWCGRRVIPLAHTSGLSTWLNDPVNNQLQVQAKRLLTQAISDARRKMAY